MKQLFIAPQVGTGTQEDAYRSVLCDYIDVQAGESFDEIDHPLRRVSLCLVTAREATLDAIAALPNVYRASPRAEDGAFATLLMTPLAAWPAQLLQTARTYLENHGVPLDGITGADTLCTVLRRVLRTHFMAQQAERDGSQAMRAVLTAGLDATVGQLPPAVRQAATGWLQSKGVNPAGWTPATPIRTVLRSAAEEIGWKRAKLGGHRL